MGVLEKPLLASPEDEKQNRRPTPFMHHDRWDQALFMSYPVDAAALQAKLPVGLVPDIKDGHAWVSIVALSELGITPIAPFLPQAVANMLGLSHLAVNVRTYVRPAGGGTPGIFFFTLDCSGLLPTAGANALFKLPYCLSKMERRMPEQTSDKKSWRMYSKGRFRKAEIDVEWEIADGCADEEKEVTQEAEFFVERYCVYNEAGPILKALFMPRGSSLWRGQITHEKWPVQRANVKYIQESVLRAVGIEPVGPCLAHYSSGVNDVTFYWEALKFA
eukprot:TRINITY_DN82045_c0_g1_i1.p1 TRINITY_DN82045_c0_g1~~TRINITY_DN82045_c0_g1_i1.p1  ORF type:complete len:275 (-),score=38.14 TRINITY_DN82045_c0_g1_i1:332-1156(-)